jgi:hypothetical protein
MARGMRFSATNRAGRPRIGPARLNDFASCRARTVSSQCGGLFSVALDPVTKTKVLQVSAATIDRVLDSARLHIDGQRKRRKGVGSAIRLSIPVRTFADWRDPPPGFFEIDMVEHCGGVKTEGEFVHTLTMTDIASGWTECVAMRVRGKRSLDHVLVRGALD